MCDHQGGSYAAPRLLVTVFIPRHIKLNIRCEARGKCRLLLSRRACMPAKAQGVEGLIYRSAAPLPRNMDQFVRICDYTIFGPGPCICPTAEHIILRMLNGQGGGTMQGESWHRDGEVDRWGDLWFNAPQKSRAEQGLSDKDKRALQPDSLYPALSCRLPGHGGTEVLLRFGCLEGSICF